MIKLNKIFYISSMIGLLAFLSACSTAEKVEEGKKNEYYVRCSVFSTNKKACHERAQKLCPAGYALIENKTPQEEWVRNKPILQQTVREAGVVGIKIKCK